MYRYQRLEILEHYRNNWLVDCSRCSYEPSKCTTFICFCKLYLFLKNPLHKSHCTRSGLPWSILMWYFRAKLSGNIFPHCSQTVWNVLLWARWTCKSSRCSTTFLGQCGHWTLTCALFLCSSSKSGVLKLSLHWCRWFLMQNNKKNSNFLISAKKKNNSRSLFYIPVYVCI